MKAPVCSSFFVFTFFILCNGRFAGSLEKKSNPGEKKQATADSIATAFGELTVDVPPEVLYDLYNQFCLTDPLIYETFG